MQNITDKVEDGGATAGGRLGSAEYNNHKNELQGPVTRSGQSFSAGSTDQLSIAMATHGMASETFVDSGSANTVEITPATGASGILIPTAYAEFEGAKVSFYVLAANTGATTLNIGQTNGTLLGAKKLWRNGNTELIADDLIPGRLITAIFDTSLDSSAGAWIMTDASSTSTTGTAAMLHVAQVATAGTLGGTSLAGAGQTRILDTVLVNNIPGASLSANTITLPAGRYWVEASAPAVQVNNHNLRLVQVAGAVIVKAGRTVLNGSDQGHAQLSHQLIVTSTQQYTLSHYTQSAVASSGLGTGLANGDPETFAEVVIWRL